MSKHSKIGIKGEDAAADFLLNKGYNIIHRNWRFRQKEIDIIASLKDTLAIVEVKTRSGTYLQWPEETVTRKKQDLLRQAATAFADANPQYRNIRFDIISVTLANETIREIAHFEEAFH